MARYRDAPGRDLERAMDLGAPVAYPKRAAPVPHPVFGEQCRNAIGVMTFVAIRAVASFELLDCFDVLNGRPLAVGDRRGRHVRTCRYLSVDDSGPQDEPSGHASLDAGDAAEIATDALQRGWIDSPAMGEMAESPPAMSNQRATKCGHPPTTGGTAERLLVIPDVAEWLGVSVSTIYRLSDGEGPNRIKFGNSVRYQECCVIAWLEEHLIAADAANSER